MKTIHRIHKDERGLEGFEYLLIAALVIIASLAGWKFLEKKISTQTIVEPGQSRFNDTDEFKLGKWSFENGIPSTANPYVGYGSKRCCEDWLIGWIKGKQEFESKKKIEVENRK